MSQDVVMYNIVTKATDKPDKCPNCKKFGHIYSTIAWSPALFSNETDVKILSSSCYGLGYRRFYRINQFLSTGYNIALLGNGYNIKQKENKNIHDTVLHDKETYYVNYAGAEWFFRINFDKRRGMYVGHFLDLGFYSGYHYTRQRFIQDNTDQGVKVKIWYKNVNYLENYQYGLCARVGFNRYVLMARYRMTDIINPQTDFNQLPRMTFGLEIGLHL